jgi:signal transduction histidine kinase
MKRRRWVYSERLARCLAACALLLALWPRAASAVAIEPPQAQVLAAADAAPPSDDDPRWRNTRLPDTQSADVAWYRVEFDLPASGADSAWMLYLPFFYGGGRIWLNGTPAAAVLESSATMRVRWERPLLLPLPPVLLRPGRNVLHLRAMSAHMPSGTGVPRLVVGTQDELQPQFDRRLFLVRTVPLVTVLTGCVAALFVIFIWLRRRQEVLYGLFGAAALLWALRTTTFVFDAMPVAWWPWWRLVYHASTGGFIIVLALFALSLAGWYRRSIALVLASYGLLGPLLYLVSGERAEMVVGRGWVAGLIPIGLSVAVLSFVAAWRQRSAGTVAIALAVALAFVAGVHDYLVAWRSPWLEANAPAWSDHRFFLLHHAANLLLVVMGALLTTRFVRSLREVEDANRTLEARVAEREREIAAGYARIAALQREQAATDERQRIMQDLHDGLGSQLFTSLSRAERGALDGPAMAEALRRSIDEMRLAIEALASDERDFRTAFGNFCFRWEPRLREAGVVPTWAIDVPDAVLAVPPHDALQLLRIAQEALTNVLKHARAKHVRVALRHDGQRLVLEVADDGLGASAQRSPAGRGQANMQSRARRLGAQLDIEAAEPGLRVRLAMPSGASA